MLREEKVKRRSDKKRDVKPTISKNLKECIYQLSYVTNTPVKDVIEIICEKGLKSRTVIEYLSCYFRRDYRYLNTTFFGDLEKESLQRKYQSNKNERVATRFSNETYEEISNLAHALDVTPSKATALLLDASIRNSYILDAFVKVYLLDHINQSRMKELKKVITYINKNNPYNEEISWFSLLANMYDQVKDTTTNLKDIIQQWLHDYYKN